MESASLFQMIEQDAVEGLKAFIAEGGSLLQKNQDGDSPLWAALKSGALSSALICIQSGADGQETDNQWSTPLHFCVWHGFTTLVAALIDEGINVDIPSQTCAPVDPSYKEFPEEPAYLPDPGPPGVFGIPRSPQEDLKAILALKASQCAAQTALHWAAIQGREKEVGHLVDAKADVNAQDRMGNTPLHMAVAFEHADLCAFLLKNGANANQGNSKGVTPVDLSEQSLDARIKKLFQ